MTTTIDTPQLTRPATGADGSAPPAGDAREAFVTRLLADTAATLDMFALHLGVELDLYATIDEREQVTSAELARHAGIHERYAREWLEQQAVAGVLTVDDEAADAATRRYALPADHREALVDPDSPFHVAGLAGMLGGTAGVLPALLDAFRSGGGVPYAAYGRALRHGIASLNQPMFLNELASTWLPAVRDVHERLSTGPAPRVLDLGCGEGGSSRAIAHAYPRATVLGIDLDADSIDQAVAAAEVEGLSGRVRFAARDAGHALTGEEPFDLVTVFQALHDMGDPVGSLRTAYAALAEGGSVLVADERVADRFRTDADIVERLAYGFSVLHCLPATMAESPVEANGTVLRASTVARWAAEAGFSGFEELAIDNLFWRFYRLTR